MNDSRARVLCVDDDADLLESYARVLKPFYEVRKAFDGEDALEIMRMDEPFAVVISDLQMPVMDGLTFLSRAFATTPNTVRVLLSGAADLNDAITAVNEGHVFRFLTKPCSNDLLLKTVAAATRQYELIESERILLSETLTSSLAALTSVLSITNPAAYGRGMRTKYFIAEFLPFIRSHNAVPRSVADWEIDVAASLSQLGCVGLSDDTASKVYYGQALTAEEQELVDRVPTMSASFVWNIPRMKGVREILLNQNKSFGRGGDNIPWGARLLKLANDFDVMVTQKLSAHNAMSVLADRRDEYDPELFALLEAYLVASAQIIAYHRDTYTISLEQLEVGMVLAEDIVAKGNDLVAARGLQITSNVLQQIGGNWRHRVSMPLRVKVPKTSIPPTASGKSGASSG